MNHLLLVILTLSFVPPVIVSAQIGNIAVTSGASLLPGLPPKGSIAAIFCTGISLSGSVSASGNPLPATLAGVTVTIGGVAAPLFAVADLGPYQQINLQVPIDVPASQATEGAQIVISQNGAQGSTKAKNVPGSPGDFFRIANTQFGVFQHASDYSLVTPDNPARAGEYIIGWATGLPRAVPPVPLGQPAPDLPLSYVPQLDIGTAIDQIGLSIDHSILLMNKVLSSNNTTGQLPIPFMGLAPGLVGVYQINFMFPEGVRTGNIPILLVRKICVGPIPGCRFPTFNSSEPVLIPVMR
ncbi:MAG: hypothetical protein IT168_04130 [Bryobacterales bacterium]|nr:hypothetical protein [Bryobacterales bacterium]